ncbi:ATP synthase F0 subunit A [Candidatus Daviesbacteria bacterium RIFCSPHIGHO2_01_FULL_44_29]|uniref:ATP synthase subunit a n=1 Tax=Candidatus Daviesbacteria bacterium RIFCSPHIGHO2_02_FULL_43_12 TaxID=1797776 RepID=A0A1F5KFV9_9BACT|nr:MAG: ATP synthase F0 subunit A [Candidatus Daviesbacteria bacterium RIFCSPHIGHO2_01_FULL_44_29]OGE38837.1 MAG: ATP synthase F0 subunit A [Candidatus Daviesbacteria bacterium RIFCSPHIGHO2_12_FULL_47_45]OGE39734.1 MAG: ATP synthase F0 subunit A [Candidatus Daviesbacteria bacterium RIFCSPHIGHO2_02_FULL_43_12]OGE69975.1 MAG: ATP synthase F0 subunit A [Candidatus Daviesbacteria bacterium RIFCSPLOWO2_01_FULL_43_15]
MEHISLAAEKIGQVGFLPITNTLIVSWIIVIVLAVLGYMAGKNVHMVPSGLQNLFESILEPLWDMTREMAHARARTFFPIIATFFLYILLANWFGLFPGFGTIGFWETKKVEPKAISQEQLATGQPGAESKEAGTSAQQNLAGSAVTQTSIAEAPHTERTFVPFFRSLNADLNMTLGLALASVVITHILALRFLGFWGYISKWISLNPIMLFVGLLELVSEGTKVLSLSLRLFGNIFAGEVVLSTISNLLAFIAPLPFYFLEIIVGVVQAAVFMLLTLVFMTLLSEKHVGAEEH